MWYSVFCRGYKRHPLSSPCYLSGGEYADCGADHFEREARIYGVTFIYHRSREVYNGSRLGKEFSANSFEQLFNGVPLPALTKTSGIDSSQQVSTDKESVLEQIFGLFPADPRDDDFIPEDELVPRRKKKKNRGRSI